MAGHLKLIVAFLSRFSTKVVCLFDVLPHSEAEVQLLLT